MSARTPMPADSRWASSSTTRFRADIVSWRTTMTRASAYRAPAATAASTATVASSSIPGSYRPAAPSTPGTPRGARSNRGWV